MKTAVPAPVRLEGTREPMTAAFSADEWPIAAAMLQFPGSGPDGRPVAEADPEHWRRLLLPIVHEGFDAFELANRWLDLAALTSERRSELRDVADGVGLGIPGYLVASRSILDPDRRQQNVRYTHDSIDAAAELGIPVVCIGLHSVQPRTPGGPLWFWTVPGSSLGDDAGELPYLVSTLRELGRHAADRGMLLSVEMYPETQVGTAAGAARLIEEVGVEAVGINPDLGNLVRVQGPIEDWEEVVLRTLPLANYWHVKSYARAESPQTGAVSTFPTSLELGMIDYRKALRYALGVGFAGTIVAEHYGGDGLGVGATNRDYLRRLLSSILEES
jgi:sugar phosphate isomerase/epimerase